MLFRLQKYRESAREMYRNGKNVFQIWDFSKKGEKTAAETPFGVSAAVVSSYDVELVYGHHLFLLIIIIKRQLQSLVVTNTYLIEISLQS